MMDRQALLDRIEQLESLLGVDRSTAGRLRDVFGLEPLHAQMLGMFMSREFVTRDGLYTVLYEGRPESEWPDEKILDVQLCKLRRQMRRKGYDVKILTRFGEGWSMPAAEKARLRRIIDRKPDADGVPVVTDAPPPPLAPAGAAKTIKERRMAFLEGA